MRGPRALGAARAGRAAFCVPALGSRYYTFLANDVVIWALFATSLNLLVGYTGLVSFGHAAYFGIGAYTRGLLMKKLGVPFLLALPGRRPAGAALFALVFGFFCVRLTRIYFAMLTLAFAQIVWAICFKWNEVTGGEQGMPESPTRASPGWRGAARRRRAGAPPSTSTSSAGAGRRSASWLLRRIVGSPFGRMLTTIRENPERAEFIGVNVRRYELAAFVARRRLRGDRRRPLRHLQPRRLPGLRVLDQVVRGPDHDAARRMAHFYGPAVGALVLLWLNQQSSSYTEYWPLVLGSDPHRPALRVPRRHRGRAGARRARRLAAEGPPCLRSATSRKSFDGFQAVGGVSFTVAARHDQPPSSARTAPASPRSSTSSPATSRPTAATVVFNGARRHRHRPARPLPARAWAARSSAPISSRGSRCSRTCRPRSSRIAARAGPVRAGRAPLSRRDARRCWRRSGCASGPPRSPAFLSHGDQKQLELGIALALEPSCCCSTSRPPACRPPRRASRSPSSSGIARERGLTLLFTEHDMEVVFSIAAAHHRAASGPGDCRRRARRVRADRRRAPRLSGREALMASPLLIRSGRSHTAYGLSQVLFGVSLAGHARRVRLPARPQRRRQDHDDARIMGLTPPAAGPHRVEGQDIARQAALPDRQAPASASCPRTGASSPTSRCGKTSTSAAAAAAARRLDGRARARTVPQAARAARDRQGGFLSGGEQQMLTIARTLMGNPELLLLDEPSEGLAPLVVDHLQAQIARLKADGLTILLAEQNVDFSLALADRVYVLEKGSIRFNGPAARCATTKPSATSCWPSSFRDPRAVKSACNAGTSRGAAPRKVLTHRGRVAYH